MVEDDDLAVGAELAGLDDPARSDRGDHGRRLLVYCRADCWMSWNVAKRLAAEGYTAVYWYPDGTAGWEAAGLPLEANRPAP